MKGFCPKCHRDGTHIVVYNTEIEPLLFGVNEHNEEKWMQYFNTRPVRCVCGWSGMGSDLAIMDWEHPN